MSIPEKRFKEKTGERFLGNGKVRCHAVARSRVRKWREEFDDFETPTADLWPECQCGQAAVEGQYVCRWHGGKTPRTKSPPRTILDVMPLEMAEKYRMVMDSPDYINRKQDINLIQARIAMILDEMNHEMGTEEAWSHVHEALVKVKQGDTANAVDYLERAIGAVENRKELWNELYKTEKLLGDLTNTQMRTAKELQSMATTEQVSGLITTLLNVVLSSVDEYIDDPMRRNAFNRMIITEVKKLSGMTTKQMMANAE